jgi:NitT/TauT family transport system substrate-binding protein
MKRNRLAGLTAAIVAALLLGSFGASQAAEALKKVVIGYSAISPNQAPAWVAQEAGIFRKNGLDVQLIFVESGTRLIQTLISGDVVAAQVAGPAAIQSNLQGSGIVLIAGILNTLDYKLIVGRDITRPDQLKGKSMAVSRVGSSSDFATRYALEKYGLIPDKDVAILQIGSQPARYAALESGKIHGIMVAIPLTAKAAKAGFNTLADLQMLGLEYQHTALAVSQNLIKTQPELAKAVLRSFVEGIHYSKTHRRETLAILAKYLKSDDADALQEAYEALVLNLIPQKPYPTVKGIQTILRELGAKDATARAARAEQFVDVSMLRELDNSGAIDRLYKSQPQSVAKVVPAPEPAAPPVQVATKEKAAQPETKTKAAVAEEKMKPATKATAAERSVASVSDKSVAPSKSTSQEYVVQLGDTLSKLSERYYNSVNKWEKIYDANRETVRNPNYIYVGMKLVIPPDA